jgi:hypothetical protein
MEKQLFEQHIQNAHKELNEGLVLFKESKKLRRLAKKIDNRLEKAADENEKKQVKDYVNTILDYAEKFERLEKLYRSGDKKKVKEMHKKLKSEAQGLVKEANKDLIKIFVKIGVGVAIFAAIASIFTGQWYIGAMIGQQAAGMTGGGNEAVRQREVQKAVEDIKNASSDKKVDLIQKNLKELA